MRVFKSANAPKISTDRFWPETSVIFGTPQHYLAAMEQADCHEISGWVWDKYKPKAPVFAELWDGDHFLTNISANQFRQNLADAGYGNGRHAFRLPTPPQIKDGQSHSIRLRRSDLASI